MLGKLSIVGAVAAILIIPTPLSAQVGGAAANPGAAVRGAVFRGIPTPGDLAGSSSSYYRSALARYRVQKTASTIASMAVRKVSPQGEKPADLPVQQAKASLSST